MENNLTPSDWRWPHFSWIEMSCKGECRMNPDFMDLLEKIRIEFDRPMPVSSGYRSPDYNSMVSHTGATGPHVHGRAADIVIQGQDAHDLLYVALKNGITGIGVRQLGSGRFLHLDNLTQSDGFPRPTIWSY
jgi:uncharacterized protein YcbK (DUF882 family)